MGIKHFIKKTADKAAGGVSKLAVLSSEELAKVEEKRDEYLSKLPNPSDKMAMELTERLLSANSIEIYNAFLTQLKELYLPLDKTIEYGDSTFDVNRNIRFINITKWVINKNESSLEKLVNVYSVLSNEPVNISLVFHRTAKTTNVFLAITNTKNSNNNTEVEKVYKARLTDALRGNFPGSEWTSTGIGKIPILDNQNPYSVAIASNIPTEKSEKFISQTIEKLIDGFVPKTSKEDYILILMASPINDVNERKLHLSELYSSLAPYANWQTNFTFNDSNSFGSSATVGVNVGASAGIQNAANSTVTDTQGQSDSASTGNSVTDGEAQTHSDSESTSVSKSKGTVSGEGDGIGLNAFGFISISSSGSLSYHKGTTNTVTKGTSESLTRSVSNSVSNTLGRALTTSKSLTKGIVKGTSLGANFGANFARASNVSATVGYGEGLTQNFTNYNVKHTLDLLENQMERYEQSTALGLWDFSAYVLSEDYNVANNIAHSYLALTQGEESFMSTSSVNVWRGDLGDDSKDAKEIASYLRELRQPIFGLNPDIIARDEDFSAYPSVVTATTPLSGKELAYSLNFPQKSIPGLPVIECTEFGRNVSSYQPLNSDEPVIKLGKIFHMNHEEDSAVNLSQNSLTSHVFITGSTGSGKSNTIYQLLNEAIENKVKFLVIEPAKGEYKEVFGNREDIKVFGTNPKLSQLLQINPFSFPDNIHVLEHLDRLVEIFNTAWPMYAAMPAVLKNAIEKSYVDCGWDLITSENKFNEKIYPTLSDVATNVKTIIDSSEYDNENKGAYKGALLTRLESLTNGLNGIIFSPNEISNDILFDANVIIDLSRVGSTETKSLLMGMLVLKLQEYRQSQSGMNKSLKHITVLEEAHNLLKNTSMSQSAEGSNLTAKSVEMLANAIAEMRTYGEAFIIADQAPGLLDPSVIRNTNTKIIMRLPDRTDRELVGKSANLNDEQIVELARLPRGVAAIYQQEWIQPVLCKVTKVDNLDNFIFDYKNAPQTITSQNSSEILLDWLMNKGISSHLRQYDLSSIKSTVLKSDLSSKIKRLFLEYISSDESNTVDWLQKLLFEILDAEQAIQLARKESDIRNWIDDVLNTLKPSLSNFSNEQKQIILLLVLNELATKNSEYSNILKSYSELNENQGGLY